MPFQRPKMKQQPKKKTSSREPLLSPKPLQKKWRAEGKAREAFQKKISAGKRPKY